MRRCVVGLFDSLKKLFSSGGKAKKPVDVAKRFELRGQTGQGSMSKVYHAYDRSLGRKICLKLLDKKKTAKFEERFTIQKLKKPSEGEICLLLKHPNIVTTYECGVTTKGEPFLVLEWVVGSGLNNLIKERDPRLDGNRINFLSQLSDALTYLHGQRFLHRDICPPNVMVDKAGIIKLIDFGLTIPYTPDYCKPGNRTGKAEYLPPEVIKRLSTDHRVDLYALGITAFEVFTGQQPWEKAGTSEEMFRKHLNVTANDPRTLNPDIDDDLAEVLLQSIEKESKSRFPTAKAFKEALEGLGRKDY